MNRIFGVGAAKTPKPSLQDAITSTDARVASIEVKIKKLDAELGRYKEQMSKLRNGPGKNAIQQRALRTLKQKKMYEQQLAQLAQQTFNMESAALTTENLRNTMATVDAMRIANKEMKKQYGKIDIDKIENMHYDMEDMIEQANEIQESLARSYQVPDELDEADLEAELEALELETEEESTSYLADLNKAPDFLDEEPIEEVRHSYQHGISHLSHGADVGQRSPSSLLNDKRLSSRLFSLTPFSLMHDTSLPHVQHIFL
ncbi:Snf7-domain-containing protein [Pterulicium gracile]|uniref:Snf7-domain-containing protein n=1 Tax=Pterulicium gracile TaxID=1884261 RepID=A0A5C3QHD6_9AGAR|nr:Snf7-domain-containing protein [Pterula gracilis]